MKLKNIYLTQQLLNAKTSKKYGKAKWILFAEYFIKKGFKVKLYEAKSTFSKYLTVEGDNKKFKVRFSNHKPSITKQLNNDCDFFVGVTNYNTTTTEQAISATLKYMNQN